ncbi:MAG: hypothetical protein AAFW47_03245 [Pseudomonadota bacterium]
MTVPLDEKTWLDAALLEAHAREDVEALAQLYEQAGLDEEGRGNTDAACFFFTHAYVFALEAGGDGAASIKAKLVANGRDH